MRVQPLLYSPRGFAKPRYATTYVRRAFADVRAWYLEKLGVAPTMNAPESFMGKETWADIGARYGGNYWDNGFNIWRDAMTDIKSRGRLNFCTPGRGMYLIYFHPPTGHAGGNGNAMGLGGMVGNENWGCAAPRPGTACLADRMAYLLCGLTSPQIEALGWPHDWPDSPNHPRGGLAHEIVHIFTDLPHGEGETITNTWYSWPNVGFLPDEAELMTAALA